MQLISDLAARSSHVYKQLHLDLTPLWKDLSEACRLERFDRPLTFDKAMSATSYNYTSLISTIRLATKGQLERLFIVVVPPEEIRTSEDTIVLSQILLQGGQMLSEMVPDSLKELHFSLPFPFSMSLGEDDPNVKRFTIERKYPEGFPEANGLLCLELFRKAQFLYGKHLTMFKFEEYDFDWHTQSEVAAFGEQRRNFTLLFQEVKKSAAFLRELELELVEERVPGAALDLIVNCPNLSLLKLNLKAVELRKGSIESIKFPPTKSIPPIKSMNLGLEGVTLDWKSKSLQSWFGSDLEYLCLSSGAGTSSTTLEVPLEALHSILSQCGKLTELKIRAVSVTASSTPPIALDLSLRGLKSLELKSTKYAANGLFSNLSAPDLRSLNVSLIPTDSSERQAALENLSHLLRASRSSLKRLRIEVNDGITASDSEQVGEGKLPFTLPEIENLNLIDLANGASRLNDLLNQLQLPKLKGLSHISRAESDHISAQMLAASSLSVETIDIIQYHWSSSSRSSSQSVWNVKKYRTEEQLTFSNLKYLLLEKDSIFFLDFFSKSQTGHLEDIGVTLEYEEQTTKSSVVQDLMTLLSSNSSSLTEISISRWPMNEDESPSFSRFIKYETALKSVKEISENPIEFSNLKSLKVQACNPLLLMFKSCLTPCLSNVRFSHLGYPSSGGERSMTGEEFKDYDEEVEIEREKEHRRVQRVEQQKKSEEDGSYEDRDHRDVDEEEELERQGDLIVDREQREAKRRAAWI